MGLRPVLGRLLTAQDDGPKAAPVAVLTYRFWTTSLNSDPAVLGKPIRLGPRSATVVGVLEPSVPYPADTEIIANVVTSPHHLGATMVTGRTHRMTELFGRLAPGASVESARAELTAVHGAMVREHPDSYSAEGARSADRDEAARPDCGAGADDPAGAARRGSRRVHHRLLERRQPDPGAVGPSRRRTGGPRRARRGQWCAAPDAACRKPHSVRRGRGARRRAGAALRVGGRALCGAVFRSRARRDARFHRAVGRRRSRHRGGHPAGVRTAAALGACASRTRPGERQHPAHAGHQSAAARVCHDADCVLVRAPRRRRHAAGDAACAAERDNRLQHAAGRRLRSPDVRDRRVRSESHGLLSAGDPPHRRVAGSGGRLHRQFRPMARCRHVRLRPLHGRWIQAGRRRRRSGGTIPPVVAAMVRGGRRAAAGGTRLHGRGSCRQRARGHRQSDRRAAVVPERERAERAHVVDRSRTSAAAGACRGGLSASSPTRTTKTSCSGRR